jgi:hypothetical protein
MAVYLMIGGVLLAGILYWRDLRRASAIRVLASQAGFHYLGNALPRSFPLQGPLEDVASAWNVIDGERKGVRIIAFDCQIGTGKSSWRRTVIAAEAGYDVFGATAFDVDLPVERSGDWVILFRPRSFSVMPVGLMPVAELEARLKAIAT